MADRSLVRPSGKMDRKKNQRGEHQQRVYENLTAQLDESFQQMRIDVSREQRELKEQQTGDPN